MDIGYQFTQALAICLNAVSHVLSWFTEVLTHFGALTFITAMLLMYVLVQRLFRKYISIGGSSDTARRKK